MNNSRDHQRCSTMPKVKIISRWLPTSNEIQLGIQIFATI
jgi:hypothetical protein